MCHLFGGGELPVDGGPPVSTSAVPHLKHVNVNLHAPDNRKSINQDGGVETPKFWFRYFTKRLEGWKRGFYRPLIVQPIYFKCPFPPWYADNIKPQTYCTRNTAGNRVRRRKTRRRKYKVQESQFVLSKHEASLHFRVVGFA